MSHYSVIITYEAKQKYIDALERSKNETQKNLINLKISTLTDYEI